MRAGNLDAFDFRIPTVGNNGGFSFWRRINPLLPTNKNNQIIFTPSLLSAVNVSPAPNIRSISRLVRATGRSDQVDCNGIKNGGISNSWNALNSAKALLDFVISNFLPIALVSGVALGFANPTLGCLAHSYSLTKFGTAGIFLISGIMLWSGEIRAAAEAWPTGLFGLFSILLLTPSFSRLILQLKLAPQEFVTGLAIFSCMPATLSSGVALTQLAGGNSALALALTVISNSLGMLIVPFSFSKFIADGFGISVPTKQLFQSLFITLLVPLMLGKILQNSFHGVAKYADQNRTRLPMISTIFLSFYSWFGLFIYLQNFPMQMLPLVWYIAWYETPWMQVSKTRSLLLTVKPVVFLGAIGMGIILHLALLAFNTLSVQSLSYIFGGHESVFAKKENARALIIVSSHKALVIVVTVVEQLRGSLGESGLLVLPCVAAHVNQVIIDSILVNFWLQKDQASINVKEV